MVGQFFATRGPINPVCGFAGDEPLHQRAPTSSLLINLYATSEDHDEVLGFSPNKAGV